MDTTDVTIGRGTMRASIGLSIAGRGLAIPLLALMLAGCGGIIGKSLEQPQVAPITKPSHALRTIPPPQRRVTVAVYDFPDLTGQYKERTNVQTFSRAVTQGGAPMLIKALQDAGERRWFSVLDRARLDDLLKERQIVTEMRRIYRDEQRISASALPPLAHAGIILQGGITGYDTNIMTGGIGARYLGIGGDTKWQQDVVTVTLRAVSTNRGEVLASVAVHKMIASYALQGGVFRYIALDRILEAEGGITHNEPRQVAVQQAIEKAVGALIVEGAELGIWRFADPVAGDEVIAAYREEKYGARLADAPHSVPRPATRNPAHVVETTPIPISAQAAPAGAAGAPPVSGTPRPPVVAPPPASVPRPPPPGKDEVLGSLPRRPATTADNSQTEPVRTSAAVRVATAHVVLPAPPVLGHQPPAQGHFAP